MLSCPSDTKVKNMISRYTEMFACWGVDVESVDFRGDFGGVSKEDFLPDFSLSSRMVLIGWNKTKFCIFESNYLQLLKSKQKLINKIVPIITIIKSLFWTPAMIICMRGFRASWVWSSRIFFKKASDISLFSVGSVTLQQVYIGGWHPESSYNRWLSHLQHICMFLSSAAAQESSNLFLTFSLRLLAVMHNAGRWDFTAIRS